MKTFKSNVTNKEHPISEKVSAKSITHSILKLIQNEMPHFTTDSFISKKELNSYRNKANKEYLLEQTGELSELDKQVLSSISDDATITDKLDGDDDQILTTGQKIADKVASFGGSWKFIISFAVFIIIWIFINVYWLSHVNFDPYPFILLNLILSCLASLQAPVIMMSQNRQEEKDRDRARKDYMINLKSELEIRMLQEEIDHFINHRFEEFVQLQREHAELMKELSKKLSISSPSQAQ